MKVEQHHRLDAVVALGNRDLPASDPLMRWVYGDIWRFEGYMIPRVAEALAKAEARGRRNALEDAAERIEAMGAEQLADGQLELLLRAARRVRELKDEGGSGG